MYMCKLLGIALAGTVTEPLLPIVGTPVPVGAVVTLTVTLVAVADATPSTVSLLNIVPTTVAVPLVGTS